ncbi:MAG: hypothetical protein MZV70_50845 [Desulfobacterales bacterium]|nr:hypothetical protein [Desulfobacterales bacterium]
MEAIKAAGYRPGKDIGIGMDVAASEFYQDGNYVLKSENKRLSTGADDRPARRPGRALPDHLHRGRPGRGRLEGLEGADRPARADRCRWWATTSSSPTPRSSARGSSRAIGNSILIKLNQIGTVTETLEAIELAKNAGYTTVISHRSGETEDSFIADLAVGVERRPDQDRLHVPQRPDRQVQPADPHRGGTGRGGPLLQDISDLHRRQPILEPGRRGRAGRRGTGHPAHRGVLMPFNTKFIFVTGGVLSSLGKGLASAVHRRAAREPRSAR